MKKFEVTITPDYVASWGIAEAIREILQNAIDADKQGFPMNWDYDDNTEELVISSQGARLTTQSLLLGFTTKSGDSSSVGQFGEGYKIAALVLLRNDMTLTIDNGPCHEIWIPRFVKSRRYGCDVLNFDVSRNRRLWPSEQLTFTIGGLSPDMFEEVKYIWPGFDGAEEPIASNYIGEAFQRPGSVYVGGLFVCNHEPYQHSYNFMPGQLALDRDRKLASSFDLEWAASKFWARSTDHEKVVELIEANAADVRYLNNNRANKEVYDMAWQRFIDKYGHNALPVDSQEEYDRLLKTQSKPIIVSSNYNTYLRNSSCYHEVEAEERIPLYTRFNDWYNKQSSLVAREEFEQLLEELENYEEENI